MQDSTFDMNLLRTLDALLVEKSVTRAAERLCISQPAMSGALQRLRVHFNDQILIRMGRDMVLTPVGESLVAPVRETLLQVQSTLTTRPSFDPKSSRRKFALAISDYGSLVLMPPLQRRLAKDTPFMSYHVEPMGGETFARVESGDLDFLISVESCEFGSRHGAARDLKMRSLHTDDFVCLVDENHSTIGDALTLEDYKALPHISVSFGQNLNTLVEQAWKRANLDIDIVATVPSFSSTLFVLPGTEMIATVQRRLAQVLAAPLGLKILECPVEVKPLQQILMWHPRNDADPGHQYLRQMFVDAAGVAPHKRAPKFRQNAIQTPQQRERGFEQIPAE